MAKLLKKKLQEKIEEQDERERKFAQMKAVSAIN